MKKLIATTIIILLTSIYSIPVSAQQVNSDPGPARLWLDFDYVDFLLSDTDIQLPEIEAESETDFTQELELDFELPALIELEVDTPLELSDTPVSPVLPENIETPETDTEVLEVETGEDEVEQEEAAEREGWGPFFRDEGLVHAELPAEGELNVSGRKFIRFDLSHTDYINDPERSSSSDLSVDQQLQVRVRGSVFDEQLVIEIDYDDSLPEVDRQRMRVLYNGHEYDLGFATFQSNAQFGDVRLSLPGSTFVSYNKQVFGLNADARLSNIDLGFWGLDEMRFYAVASQQKGETQKKVFKGDNQRRIPEPIADISPIRRVYYKPITDPDSLPLEVGSERIFLDNQNSDANDANTREDMLVENNGDTYRGDFDVLEAGEDYTINYKEGIIRFRRSIQRDFVIAVEVIDAHGDVLGGATPFMIKDEAESDFYDRYHLQNRYQLASRNIVRDDPDRVLHIRDSAGNRRDPDEDTTYVELLGLDDNGDGQIDDKHIDFELGILKFPDSQPFVNSALTDTNPTVYGPPADRQQRYEIYQELMIQETSYALGFNVVRNSEVVVVDGQTLQRDRDYSIDYQTGFLMFFDRADIDEDSEIEITYETMGIGATRDETFIGGRVEADISDNISVGATALSSQEKEESSMPRLGEEAQATLVTEVDAKWRPLHTFQEIMVDLLGYSYFEDYPLDKQLKLDLRGEWAKSTRDPNRSGSAVIDDFYGLDQVIPFSRSHLAWSVADAPQQFPGDTDILDGRSSVEFEEVKGQGHDPDPYSSDDQRSMRVRFPMSEGKYDNPAGEDTSDSKYWGAFHYQFSRMGEDLRGYQYVEMWIKWEDEPGTFSLDLGRLTENTDRGDLQTEDKRGDGVLSPGEDIGFKSHDFRFGADNGQLDSEDLNNNGRLDETERYIHFANINQNTEMIGDTTEHGWVLYRIPLTAGELKGNANTRGEKPSDTPAEFEEVLRNSRTVRLVYESAAGEGSGARRFLLEQMGITRTSWRTDAKREDAKREKFSLKTVTSAEDNRLPPPGTGKFRASSTRPRAKALALTVNDAADSSEAHTYLEFPSGSQINNHRHLKFYVHIPDSQNSDTFYVRFGTDRNNYFQYEIDPFNPAADPWVSDQGEGWYSVKIDIEQFEKDLIAKTLSDAAVHRQENRYIKGDPSLFDISRYEFLIDGASQGEEFLVTYLYLDKSRKESGRARQLEASADIRNGFINLTGRDREVDGDFRTIGLVNSPTADRFVARDETQRSLSGNMDVNRFIPGGWGIRIPLSFNWSEDVTEMEPDRVERVQDDNLGIVTDERRSIRTALNTPSRFPDFTFNWRDQDKTVDQQRRRQKWTDEEWEWSLGANYAQTFNEDILGFIPVGERISVNARANFRRFEEEKISLGEVDVSERDRLERGRRLDLDLGFVPYGWITLRPNFSYRDLNRRTLDYSGMVSRSRGTGLRIEPAQFYGFDPTVSFDLKADENFRPAEGTKNVSISGNSSLNLRTTPRLWWDKLDFLSLRYNFSLSSSGNYENLDEGVSVNRVYDDFFKDMNWLFKGPELDISADQLSIERNRATKKTAHGFSGNLDFWEPLTVRYNFSFNRTVGQTDNSINTTRSRSYSFDNRLNLVSVSSWFENNTDNSSLDVRYTLRTSTSGSKDSVEHVLNNVWNTRWSERWNTNFRFNITMGRTQDRAVTRKRQRLAPSLNFRWLVNKPEERRLLWFTNRLEINGGLSAEFNKETEESETKADNQTYSGNFGGSYNITEQIRMRFSGNFTVYRDDYRGANDRNSYGLMTSADFRF